MFDWLTGRKKDASTTTVERPARAVSTGVQDEEAAVQAAVAQLNLLFEGAPRVAPATPEEESFAAAFMAAVQECRKTFSWPGFDLPTLPASAARIMTLTQESDVSARKLAQAVMLDPVLTAKFLRLANTPFYAGTRRVASVQAAIDRLGIATVRGVVLAISLNSTILREKRIGAAAHTLWTHSIHAALASQSLATRLRLPQPPAFTLAVMHDIGKLPALLIANSIQQARPSIRPALLETLIEDTHPDVGLTLAEVWKMPAEVRLAVGCHHKVTRLEDARGCVGQHAGQLSPDEQSSLTRLLCCAVLADRSLAALGLAREPGDLTVAESGLATDLGISPPETMAYLAALPKVIKENDLGDL